MKSEDLGSSSWPVDLATSRLQSSPDMPGIDLVQREHGSIWASVASHFMIRWNLGCQKDLK